MPTYRLDLGYDGSGFRGYAAQAGQRTIQSQLEKALETVLGVVPATVVAGRTDAGVHARGQVVSFSTDEPIDTATAIRSLNGLLGAEIAVGGLQEVPDEFNARFSAKWRRYRYQLDCGTAADPLSRHVAWHVGPGFDLDSVRSDTHALIGEHDFSSFCRSAEGRSNVRRVDEARWEADEDLRRLWISATSFCHQMVRSIVGHLYDIGRGFAETESTRSVIEARDRSRVATVAPPHGLTLWEVGY